MSIRMTRISMLAATIVLGSPSNAQDSSKPQPNIAVSGCLMREGYGTYIVSKATVDGVGDGVEAAKPGVGNVFAGAPAKWILDHPGPIGSHVGETVQIIGVSSWVDATHAGPKTPADEPPSSPHIDVQSVKIVANGCA